MKAVLLRTMNDPISATLRERYFRGISARFITLRGAPFSLSPADVSLISAWESAGIPLEVVLEGIDQSFALRPGRPHAPGKIRTLSFCRASVERAFERHRERAMGGKHAAAGVKTPEKKRVARTAVEEFLVRRPSELSAIMAEYENALTLLSVERPDDEALECMDERIDAALRESVSPAARREAASAVGRDHPELRGSAKKAAVEILFAKSIREKYRVPYVSLFYY